MFSGIIEARARVIETHKLQNTVQILVERPEAFTDISGGDSIATNGVCLTIEKFSDKTIQFTLGEETLKVTGWSAEKLLGQFVNLERSLRLGDRIHGHLVSGHVDTVGVVTSVEQNDSWFVSFHIPRLDRRYVWNKGSITIQGVSLTVNRVEGETVEVCLIPETLLRTNLNLLAPQQIVNIEYDYWAKAFVNYQEQRQT